MEATHRSGFVPFVLVRQSLYRLFSLPLRGVLTASGVVGSARGFRKRACVRRTYGVTHCCSKSVVGGGGVTRSRPLEARAREMGGEGDDDRLFEY